MQLEKKYESEAALKEQILRESMKNIEKALQQVDALNHEIAVLTGTYMKCTEQFQSELQESKQTMEEQIKQLGERPRPKQLFREVTRTKKTFLFFTKSWKEIEEQGYDYTECDVWDRKKGEAQQVYGEHMDEIYDMMKFKAAELSKILKLQKQLAELLANQVNSPSSTLEEKVVVDHVEEKVEEKAEETTTPQKEAADEAAATTEQN